MTITAEELRCAGCGASIPPPHGTKPRKWCSEQCRKRQYAAACVDCGALTSGSNGRGPKASKRCAPCDRNQIAERARHRALRQRITIEAMWADGYRAREIADVVGWNPEYAPNLIASCRRRGYDLPVRNVGSSAYNKAHPEISGNARAARRSAA